MKKREWNKNKAPQNGFSCFLFILTSMMALSMAQCSDSTLDFSAPLEVDLDILSFAALLNGENVVPAVETTATAELGVMCDDRAGWRIAYTFFVDHVKREDIIGFEIHQGTRGENGRVLAFLDKSSSITVVETTAEDFIIKVITNQEEADRINPITSAQLVEEMGKSNTYADIHTKKYPSGEIRGRISQVPGREMGN